MSTVSVVMIFLDGERFIDDAIRSVVRQTYEDWELILVDDGSTDGSTEIARRWASRDHRIRYVDHAGHVNLGMSTSRNAGMRVARGELLSFLDCDDVWLPTHLEVHVAPLIADASLDATYGTYRLWHSWTGRPQDAIKDVVSRIGVEPGTVLEPGALLELFRRDGGTLPAICSMVARLDAVHALGGFVDDFRGCFEDQVYLAKVALHLRVLATGECTSLYRRHDASSCAVAIRAGTYHVSQPNPAERAYLLWLEQYLRDNAVTSGTAWRLVAQRLAVYRHPVRRAVLAMLWTRAGRAARSSARELRRVLRSTRLEPT
jgi:glycosyltransferase involved in cell wall biosynthesis